MANEDGVKKLRNLAPRGGISLPPPPQPPGIIPRKRHAVSAACETCRRRKLKCNGARPICAACAKSGGECVYESLEGETRWQAEGRKRREQDEKNRKYQAFYDFLQKRDGRAVHTLLHRVRSGEDVDEVIRTMNAADLLLHSANPSAAESSSNSTGSSSRQAGAVTLLPQNIATANALTSHSPSHHLTSRGLLPKTASGMEFELTARHRIAYPTLLPLDVSTLPINPFDKYRRENAFPSPAELAAGQVSASPLSTTALAETSTQPASPIRLVGEDTYRANDTRLEAINMVHWSTVPVTDKSAAMLVSRFLNADNAIIGFFDPETFLEDLFTGTTRFCSSFLVNSVLYVATLSYTAADYRAPVLCKLFFEACESIFSKPLTDDICTLAAVNVFSLGCLYHGRDKLGREGLEVGREMARRLKLYNVLPSSQEAQAFREMPNNWIRATSHVAWGTYNWLTIRVLFWYDEAIAIPPVLPIPGSQVNDSTITTTTTEASSSEWPSYALSEHMGQTFTYLCRLFIMVHEFAAVFIMSGAAPVAERVPLLFAEAKYQKLLAWSDTLGTAISWTNSTQHTQILLHIWFHCIILDIFRPYLGVDSNRRLKSFSSLDATPRSIFAASLNQLQRLTLLYTSNHFSSHLPYVNVSLMHIAHAVLARKFEVADTRYYFMLCVRHWQHLDVDFPIFGDVAQAFLVMATRAGVLSKLEVDVLKEELREQRDHHRLMSEASVGSLIIDFELALRNRDAAQAKAIVEGSSTEASPSREPSDL